MCSTCWKDQRGSNQQYNLLRNLNEIPSPYVFSHIHRTFTKKRKGRIYISGKCCRWLKLLVLLMAHGWICMFCGLSLGICTSYGIYIWTVRTTQRLPTPCCSMLNCWRFGRSANINCRFGFLTSRMVTNGQYNADIVYVTLKHKTSLKLLEYICSNSPKIHCMCQNYRFYFYAKKSLGY